MKQITTSLIIAAAVILGGLITPTSQAATVAQYDFSAVGASNTTNPQPASAVAANIAASNFAPILDGAASGSISPTLGMAFSSTGQNAYLGYGQLVAGSTANPSTGNDYWQFTLTPDSGYSIDYDTFVFDGLTPSAGTFTVQWDLRSSVDSYASTLGTYSSSTKSVTITGISLDISSLGTLSTPVTFRIYNYETSGNTTDGQMRVDNVTINGNAVVIPEPSTFVLVGFGLLGAALVNRRFRR